MNLTRKQQLFLLVLIVVLLLVAWFTWHVATKHKANSITPSAAEQALTPSGAASYTDLAGNPVALEDHLGRVIVVSSWASWCPPCVTQLQSLAAVAKDYTPQEVVFIGMNRAEPGQRAARFLKTIGVSKNVQLVLDPTDHYYSSVGAFSMPETLLYDTTGAVRHHEHGTLAAEELRLEINRALNKKDPE